jgi:hypothetical protein
MEVSGQPHTPVALPPRKGAGIRTLHRPSYSQSHWLVCTGFCEQIDSWTVLRCCVFFPQLMYLRVTWRELIWWIGNDWGGGRDLFESTLQLLVLNSTGNPRIEPFSDPNFNRVTIGPYRSCYAIIQDCVVAPVGTSVIDVYVGKGAR